MQNKDDLANFAIELLSSLDLGKTCELVANLVVQLSNSDFVAVLLWDDDLKRISDRFLFGKDSKKYERSIQEFSDDFVPNASEVSEIVLDDQSGGLNCYQLKNGNQLCACILWANQGKKESASVVAKLKQYPLSRVIAHVWEFRELQKENERLRNSYEEIEDKTTTLEEQTRKLILDLTTRDTIRTKHVERERLVYSISSVVRSYVDIHKVLETTVERIGSTLGVNRCLLVRPVDALGQLTVFEWVSDAHSIKDLFSTQAGQTFAQIALSKASPQALIESEFDLHEQYDRDFLKKLNMRSGLIVPLLMREQVLGVLFLQDCQRSRPWSIDDISLLGSLADQVSVAIENADLHQEKERQAVTDGLTGIANRRSFNNTFAREFERAKRYNQPLSLVLVDLDFLKVINDTFGHQIGDVVIKEIAKILKQSSRAIDLAARYGGEEFCLVLPNTDIQMAEQSAERLRKLINNLHIEGPGHISASLGVASYPVHGSDPDELFKQADDALYEAKQAGRNMVKIASSPDLEISRETTNIEVPVSSKKKSANNKGSRRKSNDLPEQKISQTELRAK